MTSWFTPGTWPNIAITSRRSWNNSVNTTSNWNSECEFHHPTVQFLGYILSADASKWTRGRSKPSGTSPNYSQSRNSDATLDSPASIADSSKAAPILTHPDPHLPFIVEVDPSTTGMGAVLFQLHREPPHLHPCTYYSLKLSPAERNYDIGNRELLTIKLAFEEWRHRLEGA